MAKENRQWRLISRPEGTVERDIFEWRVEPVPALEEGQFLVRNLYLSFDPAMRVWMNEGDSYMPAIRLGEVMRCGSVAQVVESRHPDYAVGDFVAGGFGWQDYCVTDGTGLFPSRKLPPDSPLTLPLSLLGATGLTAYFGMLEIGQVREGQTVVVSGAAGATGSVAGQLANIKGCRVIGIAGGKDKCRWLLDEAGFDAAIDYRNENVAQRLREMCPDGIDVYYDNVGGQTLDAVLGQIAQGAKIVLCGAISAYNDPRGGHGLRNYPNLITQRGTMQGFIILDYAHRFGQAVRDLGYWANQGRIVWREDIQEGLENAPEVLNRLFTGKNQGKQLLKLADPE